MTDLSDRKYYADNDPKTAAGSEKEAVAIIVRAH
jgi:hypothetical protein